MDFKTGIWTLIFFLIIVLVLTNTLDVQAFLTPVDVRITDNDGFPVDNTLIPTPTVTQTGLTGKEYKIFEIDYDKGAPKPNMSFSVSNNWMNTQQVPADTIKIYYLNEDTWEEKSIVNTEKYTKETSYTITDIKQGVYAIMGEQHREAFKEGLSFNTKIAIIIVTLFIILFSSYHHTGKKHIKKFHETDTMKRLEAYMRASVTAGHSEKEIKETLQSAGWDKKLVDQGFRRVRFF